LYIFSAIFTGFLNFAESIGIHEFIVLTRRISSIFLALKTTFLAFIGGDMIFRAVNPFTIKLNQIL